MTTVSSACFFSHQQESERGDGAQFKIVEARMVTNNSKWKHLQNFQISGIQLSVKVLQVIRPNIVHDGNPAISLRILVGLQLRHYKIP
jgi:hypothetical protein